MLLHLCLETQVEISGLELVQQVQLNQNNQQDEIYQGKNALHRVAGAKLPELPEHNVYEQVNHNYSEKRCPVLLLHHNQVEE